MPKQASSLHLFFVTFVANLGCFLFGYDFGAIAWLISSIETYSDDSVSYYATIAGDSDLLGVIAAGSGIGAIFTYMFLLWFGNKISKRDEILLSSFLYFVGGLVESSAGSLSWSSDPGFILLMIGRLIYGAGIAAAFHSVPQYVSQACPVELRGTIGSATETMISLGALTSIVIGYFNDDVFGWIILFRVGYLIALMMCLFAFFLPHSPTHLIQLHASEEDILESLRFVYPDADYEDVADLSQQVADEKKDVDIWIARLMPARDAATTTLESQWFSTLPIELQLLLTHRTLFRCLLIAVLLVFLQSMTGSSAILYYASNIFSEIYPDDINMCLIGLGLVKFVSAASMVFIGEMAGRREFLFAGLVVMVVSMVGFLVSFYYLVPWSSLLSLYVFTMGYEVSFGTLLWIMLTELFPMFTRSAANSIAVSALFVLSTVVVFALPYLEAAIGLIFVFVIFGSATLLSIVLVYLYVPDTKGADLEQAYKLVKVKVNQTNIACGFAPYEDNEDDDSLDDSDLEDSYAAKNKYVSDGVDGSDSYTTLIAAGGRSGGQII